jgi:hypothetical protein
LTLNVLWVLEVHRVVQIHIVVVMVSTPRSPILG